ncbi:GGDEF domain-containing protein [Phosphitispora fastidiosa]|uniref:GGDEF domain-containing protein n=1 Tax=Phosphitispora fastidiosa TaxID=2837202 RepID=UPI001E40A80D|nr:GGDEF domain-containing protein [Phosphitispora fastidiosa]MBU7005370.1 diguanylate cyclase (GGDEF)-like protein [Phosphitispora fastidiosa]
MENLNSGANELFICKARWLTIFGFPVLFWLYSGRISTGLLFVSVIFIFYNYLISFYHEKLSLNRYSLFLSIIDSLYLIYIFTLTFNESGGLPQVFYFLMLVMGIRHGISKYPLIVLINILLYLCTSVVGFVYHKITLSPELLLIQLTFTACFGILSSFIFKRTYQQQLEKEELIAELQSAYQQLCIYNAQVEELANTDPLTGLYNYRFFTQRLDKEIDLSKRFNRPLSLIIIDIDHFKDFNDTYGHPSGDIALKEVTLIFKNNIRDKDVLCRYGGEEFLILLPSTGIEEAYTCAERIRISVEQHCLNVPDTANSVNITISGGVACFPIDANNGEQLLRIADEVLYTAKHKGRNKIHRRR